MMSDFACMEDWDLQAVVRGCTINNEAPNTTLLANPKSCSGPLSTEQDHHDLFNFPGILETTTVLDELEGLYKPFYRPPSPQTNILACSSISVPKEVKQPQQQQSIKESAASKHRRSRKNQQKRVVQQVKAEGLGSDMWAWRKYGQKPIKGSPYPRSYYRCSSSKGCSARKQVERSCLDPGVFIVTYSSEHNHTHPTRRNSLAGSTRIKFSTPKREEEEVYSPNPTKVLSPTTPLMESIEKQCVQSANVKKEEEKMVQDSEGTENAMPHDNLILDNELFPSLEDFDELALEPDGCFLDNFLDTLF